MRSTPARHDRNASRHAEGSIKETIISMMISLAMALVAKAYVIEAFVIPTGSMAPTLLGKHMKFDSPQTGYEWTVNPWFYRENQEPLTVQKDPRPHSQLVPNVTDPMTVSRVEYDDQYFDMKTFAYEKQGLPIASPPDGEPLYSGDRILVHKYLYEVFPPERYDVVVFKNPEDATINFIKRLVGLPNEQIWLADGDVFARRHKVPKGGGTPETGPWQIRRKPAEVQRRLWRTIYSSEFMPLAPESKSFGTRWFHSPWAGEGWETTDRRIYRTEASGPTKLSWDTANYPITDWEAYNDARYNPRIPSQITGQTLQFPVGDLRMRAVVTPESEGLRVLASIKARGQTFQAALEDGAAIVRMRDADGPWSELGRTPYKGLKAGAPTSVEFWQVDQSLQIWINGKRIVEGLYDWTPGIRLYHSTGKDGGAYGPNHSLANPAAYGPAAPRTVEWTFESGPVTLSRVGLDRDIYYQPRAMGSSYDGPPGLATHPTRLATLASDQFFMLGDNSPSSQDGRLWNRVDTEVAAQIDDDMGVVNRKLLLGKAFFVYFPAPNTIEIAGFRLWVPDFGHMRFIR